MLSIKILKFLVFTYFGRESLEDAVGSRLVELSLGFEGSNRIDWTSCLPREEGDDVFTKDKHEGSRCSPEHWALRCCLDNGTISVACPNTAQQKGL